MAINFEHAWGDGVAVVRFLNEVCSTSAQDQYTPQESAAELSTRKLDFDLEDGVKTSIQKGMIFKSKAKLVKIGFYFGINFIEDHNIAKIKNCFHIRCFSLFGTLLGLKCSTVGNIFNIKNINT